MLTIKNFNGVVMYNFSPNEKLLTEEHHHPMLVPRLCPKRRHMKEWYQRRHRDIHCIVCQLLKCTEAFTASGYAITFDFPSMYLDLVEWLYHSSHNAEK